MSTKDPYEGMPESTGSPRGSTALEREATCGRAVHYYRQEQEQGGALIQINASFGDTKLDPLKVGSCFHWLIRTQPDVTQVARKEWSSEQTEAWRVYKGAMKFGYLDGLEILAYEVPVALGNPERPEYFSGALDAVARVTDTTLFPDFAVGDLVVLDFKTASSRKKSTHYLMSAQCAMYLVLARLGAFTEPQDAARFGSQTFAGMIFLEQAKLKVQTPECIHRYSATEPPWPLEVIQQWARDGHENVVKRKRNLSACRDDGYGKPCPFKFTCETDID